MWGMNIYEGLLRGICSGSTCFLSKLPAASGCEKASSAILLPSHDTMNIFVLHCTTTYLNYCRENMQRNLDLNEIFIIYKVVLFVLFFVNIRHFTTVTALLVFGEHGCFSIIYCSVFFR